MDDAARRTYADPQEATEKGAEAVAIVAARCLLDRVVFRRLPKATGADYLMRPLAAADANTDSYARLECSGIADGQETAAGRLRDKIAQLARYPDGGAGRAIVTRFCSSPVDIRSRRWP